MKCNRRYHTLSDIAWERNLIRIGDMKPAQKLYFKKYRPRHQRYVLHIFSPSERYDFADDIRFKSRRRKRKTSLKVIDNKAESLSGRTNM